MKQLSVYIAHYGNKNQKYLLQIIENFSTYKHFNVDLYIDYANDELPIKQLLKKYEKSRLNLYLQKYPLEIKEKLVFCHRKSIVKGFWVENSDYVLYVEDDILIPEIAILTAIEYSKENQICGFLRYEEKENLIDEKLIKQKYLIELNKKFPTIDKIYDDYFTIHNLHQGCWLLSLDQVKKSIEFFGDNFYIYKPNHPQYGCLEQGATGLFAENSNGEKLFEKIYPTHNLEKLLVHHLPNKYVDESGMWEGTQIYTLNELKEKIKWTS